jgi:hypothetical protein
MYEAEFDLCLRALMTLFAVESAKVEQCLTTKDYAAALSELAAAVNDSDAWYVGRQSARCAAQALDEWLDAIETWSEDADEAEMSLVEIARQELHRIAG